VESGYAQRVRSIEVIGLPATKLEIELVRRDLRQTSIFECLGANKQALSFSYHEFRHDRDTVSGLPIYLLEQQVDQGFSANRDLLSN